MLPDSEAKMMDATIRAMHLEDIPTVVSVHLQSFQNFFLSSLGQAFLRELYTSIFNDPSGISFVACVDGRVNGFVAGTDQPSGFYRRLIKQSWWRFGLASIIPVLRQPAIIPRLLRSFTMPQRVETTQRVATLMSIAVLPDTQGQQLGKQLVLAFLEECRNRQLARVNLTTDRRKNDNVNEFYRRIGFKCLRSFTTPEGREMNEYEIWL